ncbi:MAG: methionyl-tRNA formyltransferase [Armatimonadota bacterium]
MRILYFGTSSFALPPLQQLVDAGYPVVAVVTQPDRPAGRGSRLTAPPVKELAESLHLPVLQPESCRTPEFLESARSYAPELSVVAAYGQFLPDRLLMLPRLGSVNLHGSLLPKYRGAAPIQRAIWHGDAVSGVCLMWMSREMDAGDIIACTELPILPEDTAGSLGEKLAHSAAELLLGWLPAIGEGRAPRIPQDPAAVTFAPAIRKDERGVDWTQPATAIWRQVRALSPTPTAVSTFRDIPVKVLEVVPLPAEMTAAGTPGAVVESNPKVGLYVATGTGLLRICRLQPAGKRPMSGEDFLRGYHVKNDELFHSPLHPGSANGG